MWISAMNSIKENIVRSIKQWFKGLTPMNVHSQKNRELALRYYAAREFVRLDFQQKFRVGFQLGLCDHYDAMRDEDTLEEYIFEKVVRDGVLDDFMAVVRRMNTDDTE
jgi:Ethanolamine utilization protein EutJ (predicted chaperonin)